MSGPVLGVGAVVERDGALLMVRRGREPGRHLWSVPGGRVERGETPREAVAREVAEETGVTVEVEDLLGFVELASSEQGFVILDYRAFSREEVTPTPGDDAEEAAWVPLGSVRGLALVDGLGAFLASHGIV